ncbi:hypothetical protein SODALDRAFT_180996 [Sodiomyces alkalinus F11]|uniref:Uncharacterized protein n=1 Tax=Sodiomyces alkalinus (strain CBS 110278 / VKM F-3762 / F11) TaxID=1314773 RepID=A0A3N2PU85_SODAK|nr:hypothetical protein SODALDRAFT_180996 [Sodiomyces alkalinus F11]ROT38078.1 hypothetical protein SODALDRAFT_180996 [Sodiomyces alkalinus F11]
MPVPPLLHPAPLTTAHSSISPLINLISPILTPHHHHDGPRLETAVVGIRPSRGHVPPAPGSRVDSGSGSPPARRHPHFGQAYPSEPSPRGSIPWASSGVPPRPRHR